MPVRFDDQNLITDWSGAIRWDEIVALHVSKVDAIGRSVTIFVFDCSNGEFVEINTDETGFDSIRCKLANYLPLPTDWYDQIEALPLAESRTLFDRKE